MENTTQIEQQTMSDGTPTKPLYIKYFSLGDWEIIEQIKAANQMESIAAVVRWSIRKAAGRI